jgi:selenide, water dikinase
VPCPTRPDVLVGPGTFDDAGVIALDAETALVQTVDFFPPIVDDPYDFGRIAAANALSDVYAMGAEPITALNIMAFPSDRLGADVMVAILSGAASQLERAGAALVGGHSIRDREVKFGLAVTGIVQRGKLLTNASAQVGDRLVLTKPIGTGAITTAMKKGYGVREHECRAIKWMSTLNAIPARIARQCDLRAATDITGFGLIGHASEIAAASDLTVILFANRVPLVDGAIDLAGESMCSGALTRNREAYQTVVANQSRAPQPLIELMFDAETSGGLLIAVPEATLDRCLEMFVSEGHSAWIIGEVSAKSTSRVVIADATQAGGDGHDRAALHG